MSKNVDFNWIHFGLSDLYRGFLFNILSNVNMIICEPINRVLYNYIVNNRSTVLIKIQDKITIDKYQIDTPIIYLDDEQLIKLFLNKEVTIISFSLPESYYKIIKNKIIKEDIMNDLSSEPYLANTFIGKVCYYLYLRYCYTNEGVSVITFSPIIKEQKQIKDSIVFIANKWINNNYIDGGFIDYLNDKVNIIYSFVDTFIVSKRLDLLPLIKEDKKLKNVDLFSSSIIFSSNNDFFYLEENSVTKAYFSPINNVKLINKNRIINFCNTFEFGIVLPLLKISFIIKKLLMLDGINDVFGNEDWCCFLEGIGLEGIRFQGDNKCYLYKSIATFKSVFFNDGYNIDVDGIAEDIEDMFSECIYHYSLFDKDKELFFIPIAIALVFRFLLMIDDKGRDILIKLNEFSKQISQELICKKSILSIILENNKLRFCLDIVERITDAYEMMCGRNDSVIRTLYYYKEVRKKWIL